jgi:hypothetical protein
VFLPVNAQLGWLDNVVAYITVSQFCALYPTLLHLAPLRFHSVSEGAGIEARTVETLALKVRVQTF